MKPGDHPDFFRFPAPPGRSRESRIRLDGEGRFWDGDERIEHPGMQRAFAKWIARHPDDGRYILTNGYDWTYFTVEDAPFFVLGVQAREEALLLSLSDGSEEALKGPLWQGPREALYLRIKGAQFIARFTPSAQSALWPYVREEHDGWVLRIGSHSVPIGDCAPDDEPSTTG